MIRSCMRGLYVLEGVMISCSRGLYMYVHKSMIISYNRGLYSTVSRHTYLDQFSTNTTSRLYNGASNFNAVMRIQM